MLRIIYSTSFILLAAPAVAGGYVAPTQGPTVTPTPVPAATTWTGGYIGLQVETIAQGDRDQGATQAEFDGILFGVFGGYRYDLGNVVIGAEVDYLQGNGEMTFSSGIFAPGTFDVEYNSLLRAGVEVGYDLGDVLAYGTVGFATLDLAVGGSSAIDGDGMFYGLGVDYRMNDRFVVGAEILQHDFPDFGDAAGNDYDFMTVGLNFAYTF